MIRWKPDKISESIAVGALYGIKTWIIYAIVECFFMNILPWIMKPNYEYKDLHWGFVVFLFLFYMIIGLIIGGCSGLIIHIATRKSRFLKRIQQEILLARVLIFTIILAISINLIKIHVYNHSVLLTLIGSIILTIALILNIGSKEKFGWLHILFNPWSISFILLGFIWINDELLHNYSMMSTGLMALVYFIIISFSSFFIHKIVLSARWGKRNLSETIGLSLKYLTFIISIVMVVIAIIFYLKQKPLVLNVGIKSLPQTNDHPNVILIIMDTVRADHLSIYGYERDTTPNLRKLSNTTTLYTSAIASGDMTLSTHASIFTGLYPRQHGAHFFSLPDHPNGRPLAEEFHTLAEILSEKGYRTMAVVSNISFLADRFRLNQGFEYYDFRSRVPFLCKLPEFYLSRRIRDILTFFVPPEEYELFTRRADTINKEVFSLLNKREQNRAPFFLFINYMDAHWPYLPPQPFDTLYPGKIKNFGKISPRMRMTFEILKVEREITDEERCHLVSQYDGAIS